MTAPDNLTLKNIRKSPKLLEAQKTFRVSDFRTKAEQEAHIKRKAKRKPKKVKFDAVDAKVAEIIARFGYEVYQKWDTGEIDDERMNRLLRAERAREKAYILPLESIVVNLVKDCIRRHKKEKKPKGPKEAAKIIKTEARIATTGEA